MTLVPKDLQRELVRCATLAASSHNSQPWLFRLRPSRISIRPDRSRRCPIVDPDEHHLFTSIGCATENLLLAAAANGLHADASFDSEQQTVEVVFSPRAPDRSTLYQAIPSRQCSRSNYDGKAVPTAQLDELVRAASGTGIEVVLLNTQSQLDLVEEFVRRGNEAQFADRLWVKELETWIRFNASEAKDSRDGLYTKSIGAPSMPRWLASRIFPRVASARLQNTTDLPRVRGASGLLLFTSQANDIAHWIEVGRSYERFALLATSFGIRNAFLNQPLEVAQLRERFASALGLGEKRPDLLVRFGYGPMLPASFRRHLDDVVEST